MAMRGKVNVIALRMHAIVRSKKFHYLDGFPVDDRSALLRNRYGNVSGKHSNELMFPNFNFLECFFYVFPSPHLLAETF